MVLPEPVRKVKPRHVLPIVRQYSPHFCLFEFGNGLEKYVS